MYVPAASGPTLVLALEVPTLPFQPSEPVPPDAAHEVALLLLQASEVEPPASTVEGVAVNAETAALAPGGLLTLTVTETGVPAPPEPVQARV